MVHGESSEKLSEERAGVCRGVIGGVVELVCLVGSGRMHGRFAFAHLRHEESSANVMHFICGLG